MPMIVLPDIPEPLYQKLLADAKKEKRTVVQQILCEIGTGIQLRENPKERRRILMGKLHSEEPSIDPLRIDDPVDLIREDRDSR